MNKNIFFKSLGPFQSSEIIDNIILKKSIQIFDIKTLALAQKTDLTFLDSINYINEAKTTSLFLLNHR